MKKLLLFALSATVVFSACKKDDDDDPQPDPTKAKVMFMHTTLSADTVRVKANNEIVVNALPFLGNSGYVDVTGGSTNIAFVLANTNLSLKDTNTTLTVNSKYSIFSTGAVTGPSIFITNDDLSAPASGSAKVRLINLAPENLNETLYIGSTKLDSNIGYRMATPFRQVTAGSYNVIVQDPNNVPLVQQIAGQQFTAGKIYTIILTGSSTGGGSAALKLTVVSNN